MLVLERSDELGGAAVSRAVFPGVDARLSRYSYLVSLFPTALMQELGLRVSLRTRSVASYTPRGDDGLLVSDDAEASAASFMRSGEGYETWREFYARLARIAPRVSDTLLAPLPSRDAMRAALGELWTPLCVEPLAAWLERTFDSDLVRGVVLTDATIGTFAPAGDPALRQNRCFLYHVDRRRHGRLGGARRRHGRGHRRA